MRKLLRWAFVLAREEVLVYFFGAGNFADTFNVALQIPQLAGELLDHFRSGPKDERRGLARGTFVAVVGILLAPLLVGLFAFRYKAIPVKFDLTVQLSRILFLTVPFLAEGALATPLFFGVSAVAALLLTGFLIPLHPELGIRAITGIALGWVAGAVAFAFFRLRTLHQKENTDPESRLSSYWIFPVLLALPVLLGASQAPGAASWLAYGARLAGIAAGIAVMGELSPFASIAAILAVLFLSGPWVQLLFEYGRFYPEDAFQTARVLSADALLVLAWFGLRSIENGTPNPSLRARIARLSYLSVAGFVFFGALAGQKVDPWELALGAAFAAWVPLFGALWLRRSSLRVLPLAVEIFLLIGAGTLCLSTHRGLDFLLREASWRVFWSSFGATCTVLMVILLRALKLFTVLIEGWILLKFFKNYLPPNLRLS